MFYIRSSATLRRSQIERLEPKRSYTPAAPSARFWLQNRSEDTNAKPVQTSYRSGHQSNKILRNTARKLPRLSTHCKTPPYMNQLKFSNINGRVISSVENIIIPTGFSLTENDTSLQVNRSRDMNNQKMFATVDVGAENTEPIRKKIRNIDKKNILKGIKVNEVKPLMREEFKNSHQIPNHVEKRKRTNPSSKNCSIGEHTSMEVSANSSNSNLRNKTNLKEISVIESCNDRSIIVAEASMSKKAPTKRAVDFANTNSNASKFPTNSNCKKASEKCTSISARKDARPKEKEITMNHNSNNTMKQHKSNPLPKSQENNSKISKYSKTLKMLNNAKMNPGKPDINRNGSGDSEVNPPHYDVDKTKSKLSRMSNLELKKLEKFKRINSQIMEAVANISESESNSSSPIETDVIDEDSDIQSLEEIIQRARAEEEEESFNECAFQACLFLENNYPHYFLHLIRRYQLDVWTPDYVEMRTKKQDVIRIASQHSSKLRNMEKMYAQCRR